MGQKYVKYSREFQETALRRLSVAAECGAVMRELGISRQLLYSWRAGRQRDEEKQRQGAEQRLRQENLQLKKALAKKTLEVDFLKAACVKVGALRPSDTGSGAKASGK